MKNKILITLICSTCCLSAYAENQEEHKFYLGAEGTYAMSLNASIDVNNNPHSASGFTFDYSPDGWNNKLKQSFGYGLLAGYNLTDIFALELAYNSRPSFKYEKFQHATNPNGSVQDRTRHFNMQNRTILLNGVVHLASMFDILKTFKDKSKLSPFINLGIGLAENKVTNFHTYVNDGTISSGSSNGAIVTQMADKTVYKFAAQAGLGLNYDITTRWAMKVGYRFIYGGKFETQNYTLDDPDGLHSSIGAQRLPGSGNAAYPWTGTLKANEVYLGLTYSL